MAPAPGSAVGPGRTADCLGARGEPTDPRGDVKSGRDVWGWPSARGDVRSQRRPCPSGSNERVDRAAARAAPADVVVPERQPRGRPTTAQASEPSFGSGLDLRRRSSPVSPRSVIGPGDFGRRPMARATSHPCLRREAAPFMGCEPTRRQQRRSGPVDMGAIASLRSSGVVAKEDNGMAHEGLNLARRSRARRLGSDCGDQVSSAGSNSRLRTIGAASPISAPGAAGETWRGGPMDTPRAQARRTLHSYAILAGPTAWSIDCWARIAIGGGAVVAANRSAAGATFLRATLSVWWGWVPGRRSSALS